VPDHLTALVPLVHAGATCFMAGLIWFVQVVHYPLMPGAPADAARAYADRHQRRTTLVVAPVMLIEAASALALLWLPDARLTVAPAPWLGAILLGVVWVSTFAIQVPLHTRLAAAPDSAIVRRLVITNWLRTAAWTARAVLALTMLA
jgi:uncharacterized membrane protein